MDSKNQKSSKNDSVFSELVGDKLNDIVKKVVSTGVGAAFMTEESVKKIFEELPLPKEMIQGLILNAKNAKDDFTQSVREELSAYLSKVDAQKIVEGILDKYDIEVQSKIVFKKKEDFRDAKNEVK